MGDLSGRRKRVQQRERHVRIQKGRDRVRGTHLLGTTDRGTAQDMEGKGPSEGGTEPSEGNKLWTTEGGGQVRSRKESDRLRGTYPLETAYGGTGQGQDTKRKRLCDKQGSAEGETAQKKATRLTSRETFRLDLM